MTIKKVKNKVAMYLRKNFGVALPDAYKMGKVYAQTFSFHGISDSILEALAQESCYNESLEQVMSKYFEVECSTYYDEFHQEFVNDYKVKVIQDKLAVKVG